MQKKEVNIIMALRYITTLTCWTGDTAHMHVYIKTLEFLWRLGYFH
jgi:hypothetical protein